MKNSCVQWVAKELAIVLPYLFNSDLQCNSRQGWRHVFSGDCDHCSWNKLNNWLQCRRSLRCCNQSVHVYQKYLGHSQKHVCNAAYDHYNYMETRLNTISWDTRERQWQLIDKAWHLTSQQFLSTVKPSGFLLAFVLKLNKAVFEKSGKTGFLLSLPQKIFEKRTCQDNFTPRNSPLISPLLPQTGTEFAHTSRTAFLTYLWYICF